MKKAVLKTTTNYDLFELHEFNRNVIRVQHLKESMSKYGWIDAYPMHCVSNGSGKLKIKGGHHRFEVAKSLGIHVKFVECDDGGISICELEKATTSWSLQDYLNSFVRQGLAEYIAIKEYVDETGIPLSNAISILAGQSAYSGHKRNEFKDGVFRRGPQKHANELKYIILAMKEKSIPFATNNLFVQAISKVLLVDKFDINHFFRQIKFHSHVLEKKSTLIMYVDEIERLYNYSARNKIPLAFLSKQQAEIRKLGFGKGHK